MALAADRPPHRPSPNPAQHDGLTLLPPQIVPFADDERRQAISLLAEFLATFLDTETTAVK